jgi:hypothetical protein
VGQGGEVQALLHCGKVYGQQVAGVTLKMEDKDF